MEGQGKGLRRSLNVWEAIGISIALMAPSMAVNINPQGMTESVGRAVPLAFAIGTISVLLISYTFVRLCQRFHHAGSVYGFVGATLGPRCGVFAGWALAGTYLFYAVVTSTAAGRFVMEEADSLGIWPGAPDWSATAFSILALLLVVFLGTRQARSGARVILVIEAVTITLILVVAAVVLAKLFGGDGPQGQGFDMSVFSVPSGTGTSALFLGVVFALLSFAGFESSAALGEEAQNPRQDIPRAILGTAIFGGLFFVVVTAVEMMGFGTDAAGVTAFTESGSLLASLSEAYLAGWVGHLITWGATISAVGCALACVVASSRLVFAMSRDGVGIAALADIDERHGVPTKAVLGIFASALVIIAGFRLAGMDSFDTFANSGVIGTLILLVVYLLATVGVIALCFGGGRAGQDPSLRVRTWEVVIPVLAIVVLAYTVFRNIYPFPEGEAWWGPGPAVIWMVAVLILVVVRSRDAERAGERLLQSEGLAPARTSPGRQD